MARLAKRGEQAKFARETKISDGTASKWARGDMKDRAPNFENCIRIAKWAGVSPLEVFDMAERPDYRELFLDLFPNYELAPAPLQDEIGHCNSPTHARYHEMLKDILHGTRKDAGVWIHGIASNLIAMSRAATAPETQSDDLASGVKAQDVVMFDLTTEFIDTPPGALGVKISEHERKLRKRNK